MSKVAIRDIFYHISNADIDKVQDIEVVPRKIIELIIEKCNEENKDVNNSYYSRKINHIREYAELLLKQFEEDEEDENDKR